MSYLNMDGRRVAREDSDGISYYYVDHLGSTRIVMDAAGNRTYSDYAPFGLDFGGDSSERYKFTGKEDDGATGLYYYNARYYDPEIVRFISEDPVKDGENWWVYCLNNLLKYVNFNGLKPQNCSEVLKQDKYRTEYDIWHNSNWVAVDLLVGPLVPALAALKELVNMFTEDIDPRIVEFSERKAFINEAEDKLSQINTTLRYMKEFMVSDPHLFTDISFKVFMVI